MGDGDKNVLQLASLLKERADSLIKLYFRNVRFIKIQVLYVIKIECVMR